MLSWQAGHRSVRVVGVAGCVLAVARLPAIKTPAAISACFLPHRPLTSHSRSPAAAGSDRRTQRREFPAAAASGGPLNSTLCAIGAEAMSYALNDIKTIVASCVSDGRDGIGVEFYFNDELLIEIFRDDTKEEREVTLYKKGLPLSLVEYAIELYKKEIPWEFLKDE